MSIDPFEVKLFGDPSCCFLGAMFSACSSSYLSSSEVELDAFLGEGRPIDRSCFTSSLKIEFVCLLNQTRELFPLNAGRICVLHKSYQSP